MPNFLIRTTALHVITFFFTPGQRGIIYRSSSPSHYCITLHYITCLPLGRRGIFRTMPDSLVRTNALHVITCFTQACENPT
jgi:hypothetical protein